MLLHQAAEQVRLMAGINPDTGGDARGLSDSSWDAPLCFSRDLRPPIPTRRASATPRMRSRWYSGEEGGATCLSCLTTCYANGLVTPAQLEAGAEAGNTGRTLEPGAG